MAKKDTNIEIQKYIELQQIDQQLKYMQNQFALVEEQLNELLVTKQALEDLKETNTETEMMAPLSSGIFVKAALKDNKKVNVNVGSDVVVEKTVDDAKKMMHSQIDELRKVQQEIFSNIQLLVFKANSLKKELSG